MFRVPDFIDARSSSPGEGIKKSRGSASLPDKQIHEIPRCNGCNPNYVDQH